ncbi:MAG TPA: lysylphosphatidylglycerol synthase domain-containing protein [Ktedonobacterales bacterium]|nr:lysylphosphatidylglycerol synthase domain-containing protein [Ktedonobacterales bacterium]
MTQQPIPARRRRALLAVGAPTARHVTGAPSAQRRTAPPASQPLDRHREAVISQPRAPHAARVSRPLSQPLRQSTNAPIRSASASQPLRSARRSAPTTPRASAKIQAARTTRGVAALVTRGHLWLAARIVISVALLAFLISKTHLNVVVATLAHINMTYAMFGLTLGVVTVALSAWQWQVLLRYERIHLSLPLATGLYFLGITFNQVLPTSIGGDLAKATYVARYSGRAVSATGATLMARVVGLGALLLTGLPFAVAGSLLTPRLGWGVTVILGGVTLAYLAGLATLFAGPWLLRLVGAEQIVRRYAVGRKALEFAETLARYRLAPRTLLSALGISVLFYLVSNCNFYLYGLALGLHTPFWFYWAALPIASLATMLPISLNGYGVRGASFVALFALVGEAGARSLALSTAMEAQMLLFAAVGGLIVLALNRRTVRIQTPTAALAVAASVARGVANRANEERQTPALTSAH